MTGWDWKARRSRHFGYDFDALTAHAKGIGVSDEDLERVKDAACALAWVEVRRSTGGKGSFGQSQRRPRSTSVYSAAILPWL